MSVIFSGGRHGTESCIAHRSASYSSSIRSRAAELHPDAPQDKSRAVENTPNSGPLSMTGCVQSNRGFATFTRQDSSQAFILLGDSAELPAMLAEKEEELLEGQDKNPPQQ